MSLSAIPKLPHATTADIKQDSILKAFASIPILCDMLPFAVPVWYRVGTLIIRFDDNTIFWYYKVMNKKHQRTLEAIFRQPVQSNVVWKDIESLMRHLKAEITEGEGSRVRFALNGVRATFHRPHPKKETDKGALVSVRRFLENAGVKP